jgi:uncharacterized small protein (DUF1192 family)
VSAESAVRAGFVAALRAEPGLAGLNGVFEGPGVRASEPLAEIADVQASDWSTKDQRGRELRVAVRVRDLAETSARIAMLMEAVERAVARLPRVLDGWAVASCVFRRARVAAEAPGRWTGVVEWRVRMLEMED